MNVNNWLDRPGFVAAAAFVAGVVVAAIVVVLILARGDGDDGEPRVVATTTLARTPLATLPRTTATPAARTATPRATVTATPSNPRDPDDALAAFVRDELGESYIGPCPQEVGDQVPQGICSVELYRSEDLVTFGLGAPFSEGIGEAVLTRNEDGSWSIEFVQAPPVGEGALSIGVQAVVLGAGDCLNFREEPGTSAAVLTCQLDGTRAEVIDGPVEADGITWWQLDGLGWASAQFLVAAP